MIEFRFAIADLATTSFAYSPLQEAVFSLRCLHDPARYPHHRPWLRRIRPRLDALDHELLGALATPWLWVPDCLTPRPERARPTFADELDRLRTTPPELLDADFRAAYRTEKPVRARDSARVGSPARAEDSARVGSPARAGDSARAGSPASTGNPARAGASASTGSPARAGASARAGSPARAEDAARAGSPASTGSPARAGDSASTGNPASTATPATPTTTERTLPPVVARGLTDPAAFLTRIADALDAYWHTCLAPDWWPRAQSILEADLAHRGRVSAERGTGAMLSDLCHRLNWTGSHLRLSTRDFYTQAPWADTSIAGRGLVLLPSLFARGAQPLIDPARPPTLIYPARGSALLSEEAPPITDDALARLLGRPRARILDLLAEPASTTELARRLDVTPGAVSQHLAVLYDAGLLSRTRNGRVVRYARTRLGDELRRGDQ
ncbi:helix-turn-helix domain-containing protein [Streptomyces sp. NPDC019531]|uniref:helix-turn-helix domain-containing protein n=1 Tax=Streptomyces sp. NPDC019531 TaxID=3365062 RepID=UPI00384BE910